MPAWSDNDVVPVRLLVETPTPTAPQLDAPSGTAGFLRVRWHAQETTAEAYHVRARPTVDTETEEYIGKYFTGNRTVRVAADVRDYTFYGLVPGITYRSQVCRVTALHSLEHEGDTHSVPGYDTLGECSPWRSIRLPAAADADANDVKVSLEFPDGSETATLTPDTHGTLNYRVRLSGINDLSQYGSMRWGAGSWILFLKPSESRKTHRLGPGYGQVPEYFGHVARGANLSHLTWDRPASGYIDQEFDLTATMRGRGPLIVELFDHRTDHSYEDLGSQSKLCVDFEDAMGDVASPCPSAGGSTGGTGGVGGSSDGGVGGSSDGGVGGSQRGPEPTAAFQDVPESHDGATAFKLGLRFSGAPAGLDAKRDAASVLEVTGGSVTKARQTVAGANPVWEVTVTPDGTGEVTVRVPARACTEAHAVCIGGQPLGAAVEAAVPGPATQEETPQAETAAPAITSGSSYAVAENTTAITTLAATDADTDAADLTWTLTGGADQAAFSLTEAGVLTFAQAKDFESPDDDGADGSYQVTVQVSDGGNTATADLTVTLTDVNEAPTANAGDDQTGIPGAAPVTLAGSGTDPDARDTLTYAWARTAGPAVALSGADTATATFTAPAGLTEDATFTFQLTVTDAAGLTDTDSASVTVARGAALTAAFERVPDSHDGSASFDVRLRFSEEVRLSFRAFTANLLEVTGGSVVKAKRLSPPSNIAWLVSVTPSGDADVVLTLPAGGACDGMSGACTSDGRRLSQSASATIAGPARTAAPVITSASAFTAAENATAVATLTATDEDTAAADLTWSMPAGADGGADGGNFSLTAAGALAFRDAKDFEGPDDADGDGSYQVTVRVSDGDNTATADLTVTLTNVNEAPQADAGDDQESVREGAQVTLAGTGTDPDAGDTADTLSYAWTRTAGPAVALTDAHTATATFTAPTGLTADAAYTFQLEVTDTGGLSHRDTVAVTVAAPPAAADGPDDGDLRLAGGAEAHEGRVEVFHDGQWGTVCDDYWGIDDARVACRQLGYPNASEATRRARFGEGSGPIWMDNVQCGGDEAALADCTFRGWGTHNCKHREDAGVVCATGIDEASGAAAAPPIEGRDAPSSPPERGLPALDSNGRAPTLEALVDAALDGRPAQDLEALDLTDRKLGDLSGIERLFGLRSLRLRGNAVADVGPLAGLGNLRELDLSDNAVADLRPLAGLTQLRRLDLSDNAVADLWPLAGLAGLSALSLDDNAVADLSALAGLPALERLRLSRNRIADVGPLRGLIGLRDLALPGNAVADPWPLGGLAGLERLDLSANGIESPDGLSRLRELRILRLDRNRLPGLHGLAGLASLEALSLRGNAIGDLRPLAPLASLRWLDLRGNPVSDAAPLSDLRVVVWLGGPGDGGRTEPHPVLIQTPARSGPSTR